MSYPRINEQRHQTRHQPALGEGLVPGDAWSDYLPDSKILIADWRKPLSCGNYNVESATCSGQNF